MRAVLRCLPMERKRELAKETVSRGQTVQRGHLRVSRLLGVDHATVQAWIKEK